MKKLILLTLISLISLPTLYSESPQTGGSDDAMTYRLRAKLPTGLTFRYKFSEFQDVKREVKAGDEWEKMTLQRRVDIYYSMRASDKLENGFTEVKVVVDSINYEFNLPDKKTVYNSSNISAFPPFNEHDFLRYGLATEIDYDFFYSPYSEVAKITGALLADKRELFTGKEAPPTTRTELLKEYLADGMLKFIFDPMKNILPDYDIELETVWTPKLELEMGGYWWTPEPEFSITNYDRTGFLIESEIDSMSLGKKKAYFSDIASFAEIRESNVKGKISGFLSTQGTQESVIINLDIESSGDVGGRDFRQTQEVFYAWELQGTYKF